MLYNVEKSIELWSGDSEMSTDAYVTGCHGFNASESGEHRHCCKLAIGVRQNTTTENVSKKMFFEESVYAGSEILIPVYGKLYGYRGGEQNINIIILDSGGCVSTPRAC